MVMATAPGRPNGISRARWTIGRRAAAIGYHHKMAGHAGAFRRSELCALEVGDLTEVENTPGRRSCERAQYAPHRY